jgi:hypothetical protein
LHNSNVGSSSLLTFPSIDVSRLEEINEVSRVGDIWIPKIYVSPNCFIKFFIPKIEKLLQARDMILKVDVT